MNIGLITNSYPPNSNGVSRAVYGLEQVLKEKGHTVYIATPDCGITYPPHIYPIRSFKLPSTVSPDLAWPVLYVEEVSSFFKDKDIDILHSHDTMLGGAETVMVAMHLGIPCVHTYHTYVEDYEYFKMPAYRAFIRNYSRLVCDAYDGIIAPSTKVQKYLQEAGVKTKVSQIFNPVQHILENAETKGINLRNALSIPLHSKVFITFSRLAKEKNIQESIYCLAPVLRNHDAHYIVAGDGPYADVLKNLVGELGIAHKVHFSGRYEAKDIASFGETADIYVFTSKTENLPTVLTESMYAGLPVLSIADPAAQYIVRNGINGWMCKPGEMTQKATDLIYTDLSSFKYQAKLAAEAYINQPFGEIFEDYYVKTILAHSTQQKTPSLVEKQVQHLYGLTEGVLEKFLNVVTRLR
jgi:1,2-diacylglycerol 3-alpha-glucosyltransferase